MARRTGGSTNFARRFGFAGLLALMAAPASAQDYSACAKIENPFAYNQCLANHGPPAHATRAIAPPDGEDARPGASQPSADHRRVRTTIQFARGRKGRMIAEFSIAEPPAPAGSHKRNGSP